ncbi:hypothetical protein [Hymenobacter negativus]|uniref:Uncharacterized protein n=1 Tax=Hymenobacter negativus TaxID=2795026 RepID=A0ABS3Q9M5_9BACT|nr:hypothetical protein [Hymenobacter negativus]MBO2007947.1 hypothetical protein [Hymenobacter negativus]
MKASLLAVICVALLTQACTITNSPGFHSGYKKLPAAEREKIRFIPANQAIPVANGRLIYAVNARSLLNAMPPGDSTLVYVWAPHCHGSNCASLQSVQDICRHKGYQLYVVAEYFADMAQIKLQPTLDKPLLAINYPVYKSDYCPKYTSLFETELRQGQPLPDSVKYARFYLFKGSHFVKAINTLRGTQPQFEPTLTLRKRS